MLSTYFVEVFRNSLHDLFRFAWPISESEPFQWVTVAFTIVASIIIMAQWYNIIWCICTAFSYRYPMVLSQNIPKALLTTTYGASKPPIFETPFPVFLSKIAFQVADFGSSFMRVCFHNFWVSFSPISCRASLLFRVSFSPFSTCNFALSATGVFSSSFFVSFSVLFSILRLPRTYFVSIAHSIKLTVCSAFFGIKFCISTIFTQSFTGNATAKQPSAFAIAKVYPVPRLKFATMLTLIIGDRFVNHDVFLSSHSIKVSADGGISRRFGLQSLADKISIPQKRSICYV